MVLMVVLSVAIPIKRVAHLHSDKLDKLEESDRNHAGSVTASQQTRFPLFLDEIDGVTRIKAPRCTGKIH